MAKVSNSTHNPYRPNAWGMIGQVIVNLTNKGQLLVCMLGVIFIIAFSKMTTNQIASLCHEVLILLKEFHILGWVSSFVLTPIFIVMYSRTKRLHKREIELLTNRMNPTLK